MAVSATISLRGSKMLAAARVRIGGDMKRVFISDLHLHTWSYGATVTADGYNSRLYAQSRALNEVLEYLEENRVRFLYFNGDLFHTHGKVPVQAINVADRFFRMARNLGVEIRAIWGNHDIESKDGLINSVKPLFDPEELAMEWNDNDLVVRALPYCEDEERIKRFLGEAPQGAMLMLHQGVAGVPLSSGFVLDERLSPEMIPDYVKAFTGHYHFHRKVSDNLTVIGNLTALNWSDIDQPKGYVVWDDETGEMEQIVQRSAPGFVSYYSEKPIEVVTGNFVRYDRPVAVKAQQELRDGLIKEGAFSVEFVKTEQDAREIRRGEAVTIEHMIKSFETDDMEPRRKAVGQEIRENRYEAPTA